MRYQSGEEIRKGDKVLFHGEPGEIEFVVDKLVGDPVVDWGISGVFLAHIQLRLVKVGNKVAYGKYLTRQNWAVPHQYLKIRTQHGWSPWPVYLLWPSAVIGIVCLVVGLFRLT